MEMVSLTSDGRLSPRAKATAAATTTPPTNSKMESPLNCPTGKKKEGKSNVSSKLVCALLLVFVSVLTIARQPLGLSAGFHPGSNQGGQIEFKVDDDIRDRMAPLIPKVERIRDIDHYYLLPHKAGGRPKGILLLFHSCRRSGASFFILPEERIVVSDALERGLAVFAPTSRDRVSGCWTEKDLPAIEGLLGEWTARQELDALPKMGLGDSSGASYLFFVYKSLKLKSMAVYNSPQLFHPDDMEKGRAIPTALVTMTADETLSSQMISNYDELKSRNVVVPSQLYKVTPHPFTVRVCIARFWELSETDCQALLDWLPSELPKLLDRRGFVQPKEKYFPDEQQWNEVGDKVSNVVDLQGLAAVKDSFHENTAQDWFQEALEQEIKACQGFHAMTSEHYSSVLDFLTQQAGATRGGGGKSRTKKKHANNDNP
eukprot:scaffold168_cov124-Cylindrotheca_fusiformis.AAC.21